MKGRLVNPADGKVIDAEVGAPALRIAYDRLPGTIEFTMVDAEYQPGKYRFEIEAMLDGESITGWWTGTRDGKAVLSKSAKLHGQMKARGE